MNPMEKKALQHAADELRYRKSKQARIDAENDKRRREAADIKAGHLPQCSLLRCAPTCPRCK
jgi:hypothetical protein